MDLTSHDLRIMRRNLGSRPQGGNVFGTVGRCSCGWSAQVNAAPSKGGQRETIRRHASHVETVEGADFQFRLGPLVVDRAAPCSVEGCHQPALWQLWVVVQDTLRASLPVCRVEGPSIVNRPQEWGMSQSLEAPASIFRAPRDG